MNFNRFFNKPEYFFRPQQIVKRFQLNSIKNTIVETELLWGHKNFQVNAAETVGRSILSYGLYDLALSEAIYRLTNKASLCVDVGANIGYFSSLFAKYGGTVYAFEPHPVIYDRLKKNCASLVNTQCLSLALDEKAGEADLYIPSNFDSNEGIASLQPMVNSRVVKVKTKTFDEIFPSERVDVMKIDVEGHEISVLKGAIHALQAGRILNIVFEDFAGEKSQVIHFLESYGYRVFRLVKSFTNLRLVKVGEAEQIPLWEPPNYIATKMELSWEKKNSWSILLDH